MIAFTFTFTRMKPEAVPVVIPFAKWQEAANYEKFTDQPRRK